MLLLPLKRALERRDTRPRIRGTRLLPPIDVIDARKVAKLCLEQGIDCTNGHRRELSACHWVLCGFRGFRASGWRVE